MPVAEVGDAESIEDKANPPKPPAVFCRKSRLEAEALLALARIRFSGNRNPSTKLCNQKISNQVFSGTFLRLNSIALPIINHSFKK